MEQQRTEFRKNVLASFGVEGELANELLEYNQNHFEQAAIDLSSFPWPDEMFVAAWRQYAQETEETGSIVPLAKYLVQLRFPIQEGMSASEEYLAATRRGLTAEVMKQAVGFVWQAPENCEITIHATAAGHIPVITAGHRQDFISLVQALTRRNEPQPVPGSMGACMISGYCNWHRIALLRDSFLASASDCSSWTEEFQRIKAQKEMYQDRFIILSSGPYSAVPAAALGLNEQEWLRLSVIIRREHECTHYFTRHVYSSMRNSLLDELIADYMGITAAVGRFRADWLLWFFGLESFPSYREGGRLQNYRGSPSLSNEAFRMLQKLVVAAAANLETFDRVYIPEFRHASLRPVLMKILTQLTIEEIASIEAEKILQNSFFAALSTLNNKTNAWNLNSWEAVRPEFDLQKPAMAAAEVAAKGLTRH